MERLLREKARLIEAAHFSVDRIGGSEIIDISCRAVLSGDLYV